MNRTVERSRLVVSGVAAGEVVVARGFVHPRRGPVRCSAAPLLAASLCGSDRRVRVATVPAGAVAHRGGAVLFAVSYVGRDGAAVGFGAAAHADDAVGVAAAWQVVELWRPVLRTRRVLVAESAARRPRAVNATRPLVALAQARVREFADRGDVVVLVGRAGPAAVAELARQAPEATVVVETAADVAALAGVDADHVSFVVIPAVAVEQAVEVLAALRARFPRLRGQHPDEFCYAASDRREALRSVTAASDLMLVCGAAGDSETGELAEWADVRGCRPLAEVGQLRPGWLAPAATVGLAATPSARDGLLEEVIEVLSGLGPLSVVRRRVITDIDTDLDVAVRSGARSGTGPPVWWGERRWSAAGVAGGVQCGGTGT